MKAINLRTEFMKNPIGIDIKNPYLTWECAEGMQQTKMELFASADGNELFHSGIVATNKMHFRLKDVFKSRRRVTWKVRLWDENDQVGEWSEEAFFEFAFLETSCWKAKWINPEKVNLTEVNNRPASYLKNHFELTQAPSNARLYVTAHGMYVAYINGKRVGDAVLCPGTSEYKKRLEYQTVDVSSLLKQGQNDILVELGDGWYRGKSGMNNVKGNLYGEDISLLAQLEVDGQLVLVTDESWQATQNGPIQKNGLDYGEFVDARKELTDWHEVRVEPFTFDTLVCSNNVPIKEHETFSGQLIVTPKGEQVIDFGQNIAGYVELSTLATAGAKIRMVHGETLDADGNFTIENFQHYNNDPEKRVPQEVNYICKDGENHYKPSFSLFGFQYMLVETDIPIENIHFTAHAVYSDMEQTGFFECGVQEVNQLVHNTLWSMKGNFADIPTDCPTRERSGWTGDCGAFVQTGTYLMNCYPVLRKWLHEVRAEQLENGAVPGVAPLNEEPKGFKKLSDGSAGWGDAIGIVPTTLAKVYGSEDILLENYDSFKKWVDFTEKRARKTRIRNWRKFGKHKKYTVDRGFHWGEWLEPDVDSKKVIGETLMKGAPEVPTAYYAYSARSLSNVATKLGKQEDARYYAELAAKVKEAYRAFVLQDGKIHSDRQARYVRPIALDLLSDSEKKQAAADLNALVIKNEYHLNTGFLSTPFLTGVLTDYGYKDTAYKLLLQDTAPSWLYAVKKGANTIWETWTGKEEDGRVHDSLNHYSYGAVVGWLFRGVCGIKVEDETIVIEPHPSSRLGYARARYDSVYGTIEVAWSYNERGEVDYTFTIPSNMSAEVRLEGKEPEVLGAGTYTR